MMRVFGKTYEKNTGVELRWKDFAALKDVGPTPSRCVGQS